MTAEASVHQPRPRVYVRHRGRTTVAQARALAQLTPHYVIDTPLNLNEAFGHTAPLLVEIGFGNGNALLAFAQAHPEWNCLGVDVYQPGFGALMLACEREQVTNVRILATEGADLLAKLGNASVSRLHVYFPDPWPKKRHHKRRLVNAAFAQTAAACLAPGGTLLLATDWPNYAAQMLAVLAEESTLAGGEAERPASRPQTPFEAKALAAGRRVYELRYQRLG